MDDGRRARLHIGHIVDHDNGCSEVPLNLRALCGVCNQGAKYLAQKPSEKNWLMAQVRSAPTDLQKAVLEWLKKKFKEG